MADPVVLTSQVALAGCVSQCLNIPAPTAFRVAFRSSLHLSVFPKAGFTLFCAVWINLLAWVTCNVFLKGIPSLHTWEELPLEAEDLCSFSNSVVNAPFPRKGSQLVGFLTLISGYWPCYPSIRTAYSPGLWLKSSRVSRSSLRDRDFLVTVSFTDSSSSSFLSSDHLILLLSCWPCFGVACLIHFLLLFLLLNELTSTISSCRVVSGAVSGWFSSSAMVPVAGLGVATVPVTFPSDPEAFSSLWLYRAVLSRMIVIRLEKGKVEEGISPRMGPWRSQGVIANRSHWTAPEGWSWWRCWGRTQISVTTEILSCHGPALHST